MSEPKFSDVREIFVDPDAGLLKRAAQNIGAVGIFGILHYAKWAPEGKAWRNFPEVDTVERPWCEEMVSSNEEVAELLATYTGE